MIAIVTKAEEFLQNQGAWDCPVGFDNDGQEVNCDALEVAKMQGCLR